jgi:hypothetical protein
MSARRGRGIDEVCCFMARGRGIGITFLKSEYILM